jgi:Tol biopolymer transport system component
LNLVVTDVRSGTSRVIAAVGANVYRPTWSPDGRWIAFIGGDHLRVVDPAKPDSIRDLGVASSAWGTLSWTSGSDAFGRCRDGSRRANGRRAVDSAHW